MKNSSPEGSVLDGSVSTTSIPVRELRTGTWTRLVGGKVLGDAVTEHTLSGLVEETQRAARAQGYSTGWSEGRRAALAAAQETALAAAAATAQAEVRREAEHRAAVAALVAATARLENVLADACAQVEAHTTEVALSLTETLVGHELEVAKAPGLDAVRRALALMPGEPIVRIRVSAAEEHPAELTELAGVAVVVLDPSLSRGDALIETTSSVIDARVSGAMSRVKELLAS